MNLLDENQLVLQKSETEILVMNPAKIANEGELSINRGQTLISETDSVYFCSFANGILQVCINSLKLWVPSKTNDTA
jgi:hypothetical protein